MDEEVIVFVEQNDELVFEVSNVVVDTWVHSIFELQLDYNKELDYKIKAYTDNRILFFVF